MKAMQPNYVQFLTAELTMEIATIKEKVVLEMIIL